MGSRDYTMNTVGIRGIACESTGIWVVNPRALEGRFDL